MTSDLEILKKIWKNNGNTSIKLVSHQTEFGMDYIRYLCNYLFKKGQIRPIKGRRDCYEITFQGKRRLERWGIVKSRVSSLAVKRRVSNVGIEAEEKRLNLGRKIEKAVRAFSKFSSC